MMDFVTGISLVNKTEPGYSKCLCVGLADISLVFLCFFFCTGVPIVVIHRMNVPGLILDRKPCLVLQR